MYGWAAAEIIGQPITVLCPPDRVAEIEEILRKIGNDERVLYHETVRQRKDGTVFPVSVTISPIHDDQGGLIGASSIARDISERYRLQAELRLRTDDLEIAYRDLETFSYSVSHDLRAPLRALGGLSSALLDDCGGSLSEAAIGYTQRILAASKRMTQLIDDLLNLARVSRAKIHLQVLDLGAEAAEIAAELQRQGPDRHVRFTIQQPAWATADPTLIRTVLQNLLDNAWKFTSRRDDAAIEFGRPPEGTPGGGFTLGDNGRWLRPRRRREAVQAVRAIAFSLPVPWHRRRSGERETDRGTARRPYLGRRRIWCRRDLLLHAPRERNRLNHGEPKPCVRFSKLIRLLCKPKSGISSSGAIYGSASRSMMSAAPSSCMTSLISLNARPGG